MTPWTIVAEDERSEGKERHRLVVLRSPCPQLPYRIYGLEKREGPWALVDKFDVPGSNGTESADWALVQAWSLFKTVGLRPAPAERGRPIAESENAQWA